MSELKTVSFRIPAERVETLDELAATMDRDRTYVLNEAVERYLDLNEYHIKLIKKGVQAADAGEFVRDGEMKKLASKLSRAR
ncbi:MAG TPA: ribbon-helix-helix domain-containing protein [Candidatus Acidoferrum sp.]|nr:ribbon-helix-helix domain-containing protein [Candidatus Acidoferrum sp.]